MKFLFALACIAVVSADVSHLNKYLPPTAQPEISQNYLSPVAQPQLTQKFATQALPSYSSYKSTYPSTYPSNYPSTYTSTYPSYSSYPSTYSAPSLHSSSYAAPLPAVSLTNAYTVPSTYSHTVSPAVSYSPAAQITPLSYTAPAPTYSLGRETTFHGKPELNPLPNYSNVYSGFDTAYNGQVNLGTEYYTKPEYAVHQPIVAQKPIEPEVNYEPIENNDSTVVSAADYNENNGYTYKTPEEY